MFLAMVAGLDARHLVTGPSFVALAFCVSYSITGVTREPTVGLYLTSSSDQSLTQWDRDDGSLSMSYESNASDLHKNETLTIERVLEGPSINRHDQRPGCHSTQDDSVWAGVQKATQQCQMLANSL